MSNLSKQERCSACGAELQRFTSRLHCPACNKNVSLTSNQEGITIGELKEQWRREVDEASKRCDIMVGSLNLWPICAASAFVDACDRLVKANAALRLILPLAKGYNPPGQSETARRTCNEWIAAAETQLSGDSCAPETKCYSVPERVMNCIYNALQDYGNEATYWAPRTGGVLEGCPRGEPPTPAQLAANARSVVSLIDREILGRSSVVETAARPHWDGNTCDEWSRGAQDANPGANLCHWAGCHEPRAPSEAFLCAKHSEQRDNGTLPKPDYNASESPQNGKGDGT